jgi:hypothetical protein
MEPQERRGGHGNSRFPQGKKEIHKHVAPGGLS